MEEGDSVGEDLVREYCMSCGGGRRGTSIEAVDEDGPAAATYGGGRSP